MWLTESYPSPVVGVAEVLLGVCLYWCTFRLWYWAFSSQLDRAKLLDCANKAVSASFACGATAIGAVGKGGCMHITHVLRVDI